MTHQVAVLALEGVVAFDLGIPAQIFHAAWDTEGSRLYQVRTCTVDGKPVRTSGGFQCLPDHGPEILAEVDTVVVPGMRVFDQDLRPARWELTPAEEEVLRSLRPGIRIVSICTAAYALAAIGLLDGRPATTHWAYTDHFRKRHPRVRLDPDVLFIDDGDVLTSAGVAAGVDVCLHVVRRDFGAVTANGAARRTVVAPFREGGQAQFIERHIPGPTDSTTAPAREWALTRLGEPLDLAAMAARVNMSVRTFTRRFREETGMSPGQWLIRQRVEHARTLLESTDLGIDTIARRVGFGTAVSLRTHLHAAVGVSPLAYRRTFRSPAQPNSPAHERPPAQGE